MQGVSIVCSSLMLGMVCLHHGRKVGVPCKAICQLRVESCPKQHWQLTIPTRGSNRNNDALLAASGMVFGGDWQGGDSTCTFWRWWLHCGQHCGSLTNVKNCWGPDEDTCVCGSDSLCTG